MSLQYLDDSVSNYIKIAQLKSILDVVSHKELSRHYRFIIDEVLNKLSSINYQVTSYSKKLPSSLYEGYTALHFAVHSVVNMDFISDLLNRGADPTVKDKNGYTALHIALKNAGISQLSCFDFKGPFTRAVFNLLLTSHTHQNNPHNPACNYEVSHFHIACMMNNTSTVRFFIDCGVPVNLTISPDSPKLPGYSALHFAVRYSSWECVKILLDHGADLNAVDEKGMTAVHILLERNVELADFIHAEKHKIYNSLYCKSFRRELELNKAIMDMLIDKNTFFSDEHVDRYGLNFLHLSCVKKTTGLFDRLIRKMHGKLDLDINATVYYDSPLWPGYTALHFAAHFNFELFQRLLDHGADITIKDKNGLTPFDMIVQRYEPEELYAILSTQPDLKDLTFDNGKKVADVVYAMRSKESLAEFISTGESNINSCVSQDSHLWTGYSPLHLAVLFAKTSYNFEQLSKEYHARTENAYKSQLDASAVDANGYSFCDNSTFPYMRVTQLLEANADVNRQDAHGLTPLHLAFRLRKKAILNEIFKHNAKFLTNPVDKDNLSLFHICCATGRVDVAERLLTSGAVEDINSPIATSFLWYSSYVGSECFLVRPGSTALHIALAFGNFDTAWLLLKHGASVFVKDENDITPVHLAFLRNIFVRPSHICQLLLNVDMVENSRTSGGLSLFHIACYFDHVEAVQKLLDLGVDVNASVDSEIIDDRYDFSDLFSGYRPLHFAVKGHAKRVVRVLVENGADTRAKNGAGATPLHIALANYEPLSDKEMVDFLMTKINNNDKLYMEQTGLKLLHIACSTYDLATVEKLLKNGERPNSRISDKSLLWPGYTALHVLLDSFRMDNVVEENLDKCLDKCLDGIKLLLKYNADINIPDATNNTPFHIASEIEIDGEYPFIDALIESNRLFCDNPGNNDGVSHFHIACKRCPASVVEGFIQAGVCDIGRAIDHFANDAAGLTPLHLASMYNSHEVVELLLRYGADVDVEDSYGCTSYHSAVKRRPLCKKSIEKIFSSSCEKNGRNAKNVFGKTPLELLLSRIETDNIEDEVQFLLRNNCRVNIINPVTMKGLMVLLFETGKTFNYKLFKVIMDNATDLSNGPDGTTAIHNVCATNSPLRKSEDYCTVIKMFLLRGWDIDVRDKRGRTPLQIAAYYMNFQAIGALLTLGSDVNLTDNTGATPFALCWYNKSAEPDVKDHCLTTFAIHIEKLMFVGLVVNRQNRNIYNNYYVSRMRTKQAYCKELEKMQSFKLGYSLTLKDLFSPTDAMVRAYPLLSRRKREYIEEALQYKNFPAFYYLMKLQYKKILVRLRLMEPATRALNTLAKVGLPDPCTDAILKHLDNSCLKKLIESAELNRAKRPRIAGL